MSNDGLLASIDTAESPSFSFTKVNRDRTSEQYDLDSVTVQGVTEDGSPFSKARIPVDDERVIISEKTFGDDAEFAWLVANLLEEEGWEYVEQ
jgi:hypothetical protein